MIKSLLGTFVTIWMANYTRTAALPQLWYSNNKASTKVCLKQIGITRHVYTKHRQFITPGRNMVVLIYGSLINIIPAMRL